MNEKDNSSRKREWVKNAAIVFLTIMLLLTFFSNTIMNYSLPEVATEYVQTGTITEKVRGTGKLEATDPYSVVVKESRKIDSVNVKDGDVVEKDAVLFYLEDVESEELVKAEKELDELRLAYLTGLFTGDITSDVISKVETGKTGSMASYQAQLSAVDNRLTAAKNKLTSATANQQNVQSVLNNLTGQKGIKETETVDTSNETRALNSATTNQANAVAELERIKNEITVVQGKIDEATKLLGTPVTDKDGKVSLQGGIDNYYNAKSTAEANLAQASVDLEAAKAALDKVVAEGGTPELIAEAQKKYDEIKMYIYDAAVSQLDVAQGELTKAIAALESYNANMIVMASLQESLKGAESNVSNAKSTVVSSEEALSNKKLAADQAKTDSSLNKQIAEATNSTTTAKTDVEVIAAEIAKIEKEKSELIKSMTAELSLSAKNSQITEKEAEIEKLREKSVGSAIKAPVAGTVGSVKLVAGESTKPDEAVAVIQPKGKGFTLSFSATTEQAKKVSPGNIAEIQNSWYYEDVKATLASIRPDPNDPAQKKLLTFNIEGDVMEGQSMGLAVGQNSADYELVVPNSAIREDKNGKFILIVESKSSPLGNRYIATRTDVEVLAADDTHTAISAGLYGYEYTITTATKPVEAGKQVRLSE